ncbi:myb-like protein X isoform X2 [Aphidius gifuensis]|uniref:myb-like protein X isoform X2 n=1 Tax=Aphidius gifuensis TaxID=684658 RepID=UPI001CDC80A9|nr:myb-like protein X isoform X2 [Aphidius gifuensis]
MIALDKKPLKEFSLIMLITLTAFFLIFVTFDIFWQLTGRQMHDSPIFLVSFMGMIFFGVAGILLAAWCSSHVLDFWAIPCTLGLCFINSILCFVEVLQLFAFWKQRMSSCYPLSSRGPPTETLFSKAGHFAYSNNQIDTCEMATSVSGGVCIDPKIDLVVAEHGARKINLCKRRQYLDKHVSVPEFAIVTTTQVQTESGATSPAEAQTTRTEYKESLIQTPDESHLTTSCRSPLSTQATSFPGHCTSVCPASVVILRSGNTCCGSCNCGGQHCEKSPQLHYLNESQDQTFFSNLNATKNQWVETSQDTNLPETSDNSNRASGPFVLPKSIRTSLAQPRKTQTTQTQVYRNKSTNKSDDSTSDKVERKRSKSKSTPDQTPNESTKSSLSKTPEILSKKSDRSIIDLPIEEHEQKTLEIEEKLKESLSKTSSKRIKPLYREKPSKSQRTSDDIDELKLSYHSINKLNYENIDYDQEIRPRDEISWLSGFEESKDDTDDKFEPESLDNSRRTTTTSSKKAQFYQRSNESKRDSDKFEPDNLDNSRRTTVGSRQAQSYQKSIESKRDSDKFDPESLDASRRTTVASRQAQSYQKSIESQRDTEELDPESLDASRRTTLASRKAQSFQRSSELKRDTEQFDPESIDSSRRTTAGSRQGQSYQRSSESKRDTEQLDPESIDSSRRTTIGSRQAQSLYKNNESKRDTEQLDPESIDSSRRTTAGSRQAQSLYKNNESKRNTEQFEQDNLDNSRRTTESGWTQSSQRSNESKRDTENTDNSRRTTVSSRRTPQSFQRSIDTVTSPIKLRSSTSYTLRQETPRLSSVDEGSPQQIGYSSKTPSRISLVQRDDAEFIGSFHAPIMESLDEANEEQQSTYD